MSWPSVPIRGTTIKLGDAIAWLSPNCDFIACACVGPLSGDYICRCHRMTVESLALRQTAHTLDRLLEMRVNDT